jgi:hypothetical protein
LGRAAFGLLGAGGRFCPFGMASGSFAPVTPELAESRQVAVLRGGPASAAESAAVSRSATLWTWSANRRMITSVANTATAVGTVPRALGIHIAGSLKRS